MPNRAAVLLLSTAAVRKYIYSCTVSKYNFAVLYLNISI